MLPSALCENYCSLTAGEVSLNLYQYITKCDIYVALQFTIYFVWFDINISLIVKMVRNNIEMR